MAEKTLDINSFVLDGEEPSFQEGKTPVGGTPSPADTRQDTPAPEPAPVPTAEADEETDTQTPDAAAPPADTPAADAEEEEESLDFTPFLSAFLESRGEELDAESIKDLDLGSFEGFNTWMDSYVSERSKPQYANEEEARFAEYLSNGGKPQDYVKLFYESPKYDSIKVDSDASRNKVLFDYYKKTTKFSDEKINGYLDYIKDTDSYEKEAEEALSFLQQSQKEEEGKLLQEQAAQKEKQQKAHQDYLNNIRAEIDKQQEIAGIPFSKGEKDKFYAFLSEKGKDGYTPYQRMYQEDATLELKLAALAYKQAHKGKIHTQEQTLATRKVQENLKKLSTGSSRKSASVGEPNPNVKPQQTFNKFVLN